MADAIDHRTVRQVLREQLLTVTGVSAPIIAYENRAFIPPTGLAALWIKERYIPVRDWQPAWGLLEGRGQVAYHVNFAAGQGSETADDLAEEIARVFKPGTDLVSQGIAVSIDRASRSPGMIDEEDPTWYFVPVVITWRTYVSTS